MPDEEIEYKISNYCSNCNEVVETEILFTCMTHRAPYPQKHEINLPRHKMQSLEFFQLYLNF